jgi:putative SOS response-associated peptidase YedK
MADTNPDASAHFRFTLSDQPIYAFAGLWDAWKSPAGDWLQSFSAITVEANPAMGTIHDRMPAILRPQDYDEWLDRGEVERPPTHLPSHHERDYEPDGNFARVATLIAFGNRRHVSGLR